MIRGYHLVLTRLNLPLLLLLLRHRPSGSPIPLATISPLPLSFVPPSSLHPSFPSYIGLGVCSGVRPVYTCDGAEPAQHNVAF
eukprot:scaffold60391_cov35-Tisochrysis_lutea.AAC.1